jgi:hypothetical protein
MTGDFPSRTPGSPAAVSPHSDGAGTWVVTERLIQQWDTTGWTDYHRSTFEYNPDATLRELLSYWPAGGGWSASHKYSHLYDSAGRLTSYLQQMRDLGEWRNVSVDLYTYDEQGLRLDRILRTWSLDHWNDRWREEYSYDSAGRIEVQLNKDTSWNGWKDFSRSVHSYDDEGREIEVLGSIWKGGAWQPSGRTLVTYDPGGVFVRRLDQLYDSTGYVNAWSYTDSLGFDGTELGRTIERWDVVEWTKIGRSEYYYDTDGNNSEIRFYSWDGAVWGVNTRYLYTWQELATAVEDPSDPQAGYRLSQNYPNPFNPATTIAYALPARGHVRLSLFNMLGQEVAVLVDEEQEAGIRSVAFDATALPSGVYVYRIVAGEYSSQRRMVLIR